MKPIHKILIVIVTALLGGLGFWYLKNAPLNYSATKLTLNEQPQDAEFYIANGWTGGMGSTPVLDESGNHPLEFNSKPIFFDESKVAEALKLGKMPDCVTGRPIIKVKANITLVQKVGTNSSIPPDSAGKQPEQSYVTAQVNRLDSVVITAEACTL